MPELLHEMVEAQAGRAPHAAAVRCGDELLSYRELDQRANRLARWLQNLGVGPEDRVGVCLPRFVELAVAVLGVLKAGAAYVPLDPRYPPARLELMLSDTRVQVVVSQDGWADRIELVGAGRVVVTVAGPEVAECPVSPPTVEVDPNNLAYVLYTSGSAGRPKGVALPHRAAANYLAYLGECWDLGPGDVVLQLASIGFSAAVRDLLGPLVNGATVELLPDRDGSFPQQVAERLTAGGITCLLSCLPSLLQALLEAAEIPRGALRLVMLISETFTPRLVGLINRRWGHEVRVVHQYGLTECAMTSASGVVGPQMQHAKKVPVGRPIANVRMHVLDDRLKPVVAGAVGELYVGGVGLARGYLGKPALTAEWFVPDPSSSGGGDRLYRTGDLGRCLPDGTIELVGRADRQVKVRGFRIELDEVETVLSGYPGLRSAAVERHDSSDDVRLVGYIVPRMGEMPSPESLRTYLLHSLPEQMVPTKYVTLDALPVLPNGKVDRSALPTSASSRSVLAEDTLASLLPASRHDRGRREPLSLAEQTLARVWSEVLGVQRVDRHDNFFDLGGNSLLITRLAARIRKVFRVDLPLGEVFEHPELSDLAGRIEQAVLRDIVGD